MAQTRKKIKNIEREYTAFFFTEKNTPVKRPAPNREYKIKIVRGNDFKNAWTIGTEKYSKARLSNLNKYLEPFSGDKVIVYEHLLQGRAGTKFKLDKDDNKIQKTELVKVKNPRWKGKGDEEHSEYINKKIKGRLVREPVYTLDSLGRKRAVYETIRVTRISTPKKGQQTRPLLVDFTQPNAKKKTTLLRNAFMRESVSDRVLVTQFLSDFSRVTCTLNLNAETIADSILNQGVNILFPEFEPTDRLQVRWQVNLLGEPLTGVVVVHDGWSFIKGKDGAQLRVQNNTLDKLPENLSMSLVDRIRSTGYSFTEIRTLQKFEVPNKEIQAKHPLAIKARKGETDRDGMPFRPHSELWLYDYDDDPESDKEWGLIDLHKPVVLTLEIVNMDAEIRKSKATQKRSQEAKIKK
jgi:hypothetical protein